MGAELLGVIEPLVRKLGPAHAYGGVGVGSCLAGGGHGVEVGDLSVEFFMGGGCSFHPIIYLLLPHNFTATPFL